MCFSYKSFKRILDILLAVFSLILAAPLFLVIYIGIKREKNGPVIFKQERIGYRAEPFILYKFRTMYVDSEKNGIPQLCRNSDERLTKIGRFLRSFHLDELPQLWNVLKGDMSFVGYRPERRYFIEQIMSINPDYQLLYQMRPGIFSDATLYNGYTDTMEKMLKRLDMDLDYLQHASFARDIRIIFSTIISIVSCKKI